MPRILLTRPQKDSEHLAAKLQSLGYQTVIEPLLTLHPLPASAPDFAAIQDVMITRANVFAFLSAIDVLLGKPCFCVGDETAAQAKAFGFRDARSGHGNGVDLAQSISRNAPGQTILHICGRDTDGRAQDALRRAGHILKVWPVYTARKAPRLSPALLDAFARNEIDGILLFSARTAEALAALLRRHQCEAAARSMTAIGLSPTIADRIAALPWKKLAAADVPTEDAVIACLQSLLPVA